MYKTPTWHTRQARDTYKVYKTGTRHLQGVQGRYEIPTMSTRWVQDTYKGYEAGTRHLDGKAATLWKNE